MTVLTRVEDFVALGGPVVGLILLLSVLALAVALWKVWQLSAAGVGRHTTLLQALDAWDRGDAPHARAALRRARSHLGPVLASALDLSDDPEVKPRIEAEAALRLDTLDRGLRFLDSVAQIAPLLGLFGTVLGMIDAFRALQEAGTAVDPSLLAGGIWVALMTTAAGLALAMPASLAVTWFETRTAAERALAETALQRIFHPVAQRPATDPVPGGLRHAG
ncbi:MotA/TolQ/ExbB proton channel family protein [Rhodobacterales bacterium HKCCE2091]|nr:MotA/TolQ/ExbB proton channel family protein [Rhodobacterales bacterium HKCCE2091]